MSAHISVDELTDTEFRVTVSEGSNKTSHRVTLKPADYRRLAAGKVDPQELIRKSFEFLLEHEPKESILQKFDLILISHYFPAFEREIKRRINTP